MEFQKLTVIPEINTLVDMIGGQWMDDQFLNKLDAIDQEVDHFLREFMNAESFSVESEALLCTPLPSITKVIQEIPPHTKDEFLNAEFWKHTSNRLKKIAETIELMEKMIGY